MTEKFYYAFIMLWQKYFCPYYLERNEMFVFISNRDQYFIMFSVNGLKSYNKILVHLLRT